MNLYGIVGASALAFLCIGIPLLSEHDDKVIALWGRFLDWLFDDLLPRKGNDYESR